MLPWQSREQRALRAPGGGALTQRVIDLFLVKGLGAETKEAKALYMVSERGEFSCVASLSMRINLDGLPFPASLSPSCYSCVYWPVLLEHHFPHGFRDHFYFFSCK